MNLPRIVEARRTERQGINAAREFFENASCVFQEVDQQNDYGKDAYVDVGDRVQGRITPLCIALQIKSGPSYRTSSGGYFVPIGQHATLWRESTIPVFGLVFDPQDRRLRWQDLTGYLRAHPSLNEGRIPVSAEALLDEGALIGALRSTIETYRSNRSSPLAMNLLSEDPEVQAAAVFDAWALGRGDARFLLILRRLIVHLDPKSTKRCIWLLSHAVDRGDIFWTQENWIPDHVKMLVRTSFRWSVEEICHMFLALGEDDWGRGSLGMSIHLLLAQDAFFGDNLTEVIHALLAKSELRRAVLVTWLALSARPEDPRGRLEELISQEPLLLEDEWVGDIRAALKWENKFSIYD